VTTFRYTAVGSGGERVTGSLESASQTEAIASLQRKGLLPLQAEPVSSGAPGRGLWRLDVGGRDRLRRQDVANLMREFATMLSAGQDLDRALRYMEVTSPKRVRKVVTGLRDAVRDGSPLSTAMARYPAIFPAAQIGLVKAGEAGGNLGVTFEQIADLLDRQRALASTVTSALIYPAILLIAMTGAVALLLTRVMPQFVPLFEQNGVALPPSTRFLIDSGAFIQDYSGWLLVAVVALGAVARFALSQGSVRVLVDGVLPRLPLIGGLAREVLAARLTRVLGTLLQNGVALVPALSIVRDAIGNRAAQEAVGRMSLAARGGGGLTQDLESSGLFPARTVHFLRLGDETAQLAGMSLRAAQIHEERVRIMTQRMTAMLVPALTILMGLAVGGIVASLMTAMLSLNDLAAG
jgi:general secretion pathway protein F